MKKISKNNAGFSMVEVLAATVIFAIATTGIYTMLSNIRTPAANTEDRLEAALCGRQILEALKSQVYEGTMDEGALAEGTGIDPAGYKTDACAGLSVTYDVDQGDPVDIYEDHLKVTIDIDGLLP